MLLRRADADDSHPIPIIFNLFSWSENRKPLKDWLEDELHSKYQVPRNIALQWIEDDALLLLLDGLDEVHSRRRNDCLQAINQFLENHGLVNTVICSRVAEYDSLQRQLKLNGAVVIEPFVVTPKSWTQG